MLGDSRWHHFAMCCDGTNLTLYVDGAPQGTTPIVRFLQDGDRMAIGCQLSEGTPRTLAYGFRGNIDDIRVSRTVRYTGSFEPAPRLAADADTAVFLDFETARNGKPVVRSDDPFLAETLGSPPRVPASRPGVP
jgi:hypothetical protein